MSASSVSVGVGRADERALRQTRAARRRSTLERRLAEWRRARAALLAHPHPSPKRHAQRLATIAWHEATILDELRALERTGG